MASIVTETEVAQVGRVVTPVLIESLKDLWEAEAGRIDPDQVRRIEIPEAIVDTGSTYVSLPMSLISQLGLAFIQEREGITTAGPKRTNVYGPARLTIQGRTCPIDVAEVPEGTPVLVGYVALEILDLVPLPKEGRLVPNPAHGGRWMFDMY